MARDPGKGSEAAPGLLWLRERPEGAGKARMAEIVAAAVQLADAHGLEALSMRRLAESLDAGAMSLYRYVANKDELIELMVDAVLGEPESRAPSGAWRADLTGVARESRKLMLRHPWFAQQSASRPPLGPNALRRMDFALAAALSMGVDITTAGAVLATLMSFVYGFVLAERAEIEAQRRTGQSEAEWRASIAPYIRKVLAEGKHSHVAARIRDAEELDSEAQFQFGLDCLLDGLEARYAAKERGSSGVRARTRKKRR